MQNRKRAITKSYTPDITNQPDSIMLTKLEPKTPRTNPSKSLDERFHTNLVELPMLSIKKVLTKIGGIPKSRFEPPAEQYNAFHLAKEKELRDFYYKRSPRRRPFNYELDAIVLDCYEHGKDLGRETVWKKYRDNCNDLTYDTLRVITNKRRL